MKIQENQLKEANSQDVSISNETTATNTVPVIQLPIKNTEESQRIITAENENDK